MSDQMPFPDAQDRVLATLRRLVRRMGEFHGLDHVACELRMGISTLRRRLGPETPLAQWTGEEVVRLLVIERDVYQDSSLLNAFIEVDGRQGGPGEAVAAETELRALTRTMATELAAILRRQEDGLDDREAQETADELRQLATLATSASRHLYAKAGRT